jgi:hypothetical protein
VFGFIIIVTLASNTDTDTVRDVAYTTSPQLFVQRRINANVFGTHVLGSKCFNGLDSLGSARLEGTAMDVLVEMDGVFTSDNVSQSGPLLGSVLDHDRMDGWMDG